MTEVMLLGGVASFALASAWVGPDLLSRAHWTVHAPRAALVLWYAFGLSSIIATIGLISTVGIRPWRVALVPGLGRAARCLLECRWGAFTPLQLTLLLLAAGLGLQLIVLLGNEVRRVALDRHRHRRVLGLVAQQIPSGAGMLLLEHPRPVAYGVPGLRPTIVLSTGTLAVLNEHELRAVLAHERAHMRAHHDLAVLPFAALASAFPGLPLARKGLPAVRSLVEMLADDAAAKHESTSALAAAIARVAQSAAPRGILSGGVSVTRRVHRLLGGNHSTPPWTKPLVYSMAALVVAVPCALLAAASANLR